MTMQPVFRESALHQLIVNLPNNIEQYLSDDSWVDNYFGSDGWKVASKLNALPDDLLLLPDSSGDNDLQNAERLYNALHGLTLTQATDPRLWSYLSHVTFWKYMRQRWPIEKSVRGGDVQKGAGSIKDRYFLIGDRSRGVTRHGIARLWWAGYTCYSEADSSFELAQPLFSKQDVFASFMERAFSKNKNVMHAILEVMLERYKSGKPFDDREKVRSLAKHLVLVGGVTILDAIDTEQMKQSIREKIESLEQQAA